MDARRQMLKRSWSCTEQKNSGRIGRSPGSSSRRCRDSPPSSEPSIVRLSSSNPLTPGSSTLGTSFSPLPSPAPPFSPNSSLVHPSLPIHDIALHSIFSSSWLLFHLQLTSLPLCSSLSHPSPSPLIKLLFSHLSKPSCVPLTYRLSGLLFWPLLLFFQFSWPSSRALFLFAMLIGKTRRVEALCRAQCEEIQPTHDSVNQRQARVGVWLSSDRHEEDQMRK